MNPLDITIHQEDGCGKSSAKKAYYGVKFFGGAAWRKGGKNK